MSQNLFQQINLYQPLFRRQKQIFSSRTLLQSSAVIAVALLTIHVYGVFRVAGLERQAIELEGREHAYATQLASVDPSSSRLERQARERELARLTQQVRNQQQLIDMLENQPPGRTAGFSAYLEALALTVTPRIWLTELSVNGATEAIELVGRATAADLVPSYLQRLGEQEALSGQRFDEFGIERTDGQVSFRVTSQAVGQAEDGRR